MSLAAGSILLVTVNVTDSIRADQELRSEKKKLVDHLLPKCPVRILVLRL